MPRRWLLDTFRLLRVILATWAAQAHASHHDMLQQENEALRKKLGNKANSVWHMNRQRLLQEIRRNFHLAESYLASLKVPDLRETLRSLREQCSPQTDILKGISKKNRAELEAMALELGLFPMEGRWKNMTQIILAIKNHVRPQDMEEEDNE